MRKLCVRERLGFLSALSTRWRQLGRVIQCTARGLSSIEHCPKSAAGHHDGHTHATEPSSSMRPVPVSALLLAKSDPHSGCRPSGTGLPPEPPSHWHQRAARPGPGPALGAQHPEPARQHTRHLVHRGGSLSSPEVRLGTPSDSGSLTPVVPAAAAARGQQATQCTPQWHFTGRSDRRRPLTPVQAQVKSALR